MGYSPWGCRESDRMNPHESTFIYVCVSIVFAGILYLILSIKNNGMIYKHIQNYQLLLPLMGSVRPACMVNI